MRPQLTVTTAGASPLTTAGVLTTVVTLAISAVAAVSAVAAASPASAAALVTRCSGTAGAVTVPGDLVVPRGSVCELEGTTVEGDVRVAAAGDLILTGARVGGKILVQADALLDATDSTVAGIDARRSFGVFLQGTEAGAVDARGGAVLYSLDSSHAGDVTVVGGETLLESTRVGGAVTATSGRYADVEDSTVSGALAVHGTTEGSIVCTSEVDGAATFTGNAGLVYLGADRTPGGCGFNAFGGDVTVSGNTADIRVVGNLVRGDLACAGNETAPTGQDNRVRGESTGQCAELAPVPGTGALRMQALPEAGGDRGELLVDRLEQRRATSAQELAGLGAADLG